MTREEREKAIDALKISAPVMAVTQEEFNDYIQTLNKVMDWLEQEPTTKNDLGVDCISRADARNAIIDYQYSDGFCEEHSIDHSINTSMALIALSDLPPVTPQEPITNFNIPFLMHKELDIPISECQKAYNVAIEYLKSTVRVKG